MLCDQPLGDYDCEPKLLTSMSFSMNKSFMFDLSTDIEYELVHPVITALIMILMKI